jgi:hypothetical protein
VKALPIAWCSFCPQQPGWLAYQVGTDAVGRPMFMCFECREAAKRELKERTYVHHNRGGKNLRNEPSANAVG